MNKTLKYVLPILGAAAGAACVTAFLIAPGKAEEDKKTPFAGRNFAHRGLHKMDKSVPENSLAAFRDAVENGYGVELDVHLTADSRLVVFHDDDIERVCSGEGRIEEMTYAELKHFRLCGTKEGIPLLSEVLEVIAGKAPIVLELKRGDRNSELCERVYDILRCYGGDVCIESFDPFIVRWWKKHAPEVLRGQLSCPVEKFGEGTSKFKAFLLSNLLTNFICRPQFIAYGISEKKPLLVRLCEKMGAMKVAWTSRDWSTESDNDAVIFEFYRPRIKYK